MEYQDEPDDVPGMDDISEEDNLEMLQEAVDDGEIDPESPGYGIALSVLHGNWDRLSAKQRNAFTKYVQPILEQRAVRLAAQRIADRAPD